MHKLESPIGMTVFDAGLALKLSAARSALKDSLPCAVVQRVQADCLVANDRTLTRAPLVATATSREAQLICGR